MIFETHITATDGRFLWVTVGFGHEHVRAWFGTEREPAFEIGLRFEQVPRGGLGRVLETFVSLARFEELCMEARAAGDDGAVSLTDTRNLYPADVLGEIAQVAAAARACRVTGQEGLAHGRR